MTRGRSSPDVRGGRRALEAARRTFIASMRRGDAAALASLYAHDAIVVPQISKICRGRASVEKLFRGWLTSTQVRKFEATTEDLRIIEDTAYAVGTYRMTCEDASGGRLSDEGKFLMVYERGPKGEWQITRDMSNSNRQ